MAVVDSLRAFKRTQPVAADGSVTSREFVAAQSDLEVALGSLLTFCRSAVPAGLILPASLTAANIAGYFDSTGLGLIGKPWAGWAICNGNNGTPNLDGKFPRFETSAAGATGGSDSSAHTHAVDPGSFTSGAEAAHTHTTPSHSHVTEMGFDGTNWFAKTNGSGLPASGSTVEGSVSGLNPAHGDTEATISVRLAHTRTDGSGTSGAGSSHTHAIDVPSTTSGAASASDNRPAYYELVPIMRL